MVFIMYQKTTDNSRGFLLPCSLSGSRRPLFFLSRGADDEVHPYDIKDISVILQIVLHGPVFFYVPCITVELFVDIGQYLLLLAGQIGIDTSSHSCLTVKVQDSGREKIAFFQPLRHCLVPQINFVIEEYILQDDSFVLCNGRHLVKAQDGLLRPAQERYRIVTEMLTLDEKVSQGLTFLIHLIVKDQPVLKVMKAEREGGTAKKFVRVLGVPIITVSLVYDVGIIDSDMLDDIMEKIL